MNKQISVLIVDDEATIRSTFRLATKKRGWQLEDVESAEEALELLGEKDFDIALIDKNLPEMSGVELIRQIRGMNNQMGIIMMTAMPTFGSAVETLHLGIDSYVEKPFDDIYDVVEKVEEVVAAQKQSSRISDSSAAHLHFRMAVDSLRGGDASSDEHLHVLLASPDNADRDWIVKQFGNSTHVHITDSSDEALKIAGREQPQFLLVDISLDHTNILKFLKEFKIYAPQTAVVLLTESMPPLNSIPPLIEIGVQVIIDQPFDTAVFRSKLDYVAQEAGPGGIAIQWSKEPE